MSQKVIYIIIGVLSSILLFRIFLFYQNIHDYESGSVVTWQTRVSASPKLKVNGQQVTLTMPNYQRVVVKFKIIPVISYADTINVRGKIDYFIAENGNRVAYMNYPEFQIVEKGSDSNLIFYFREKIIKFFNSSLPQAWSSLMLGIVFGIKEEMPASFYLDLQKTGLMHVIAASGMNITMLGGFLSAGLILFFRRQVALVLTITGIIIYAVLAGLEPSIVRASIMGILVFIAQMTGRQNSAFLALFLAGFVMLFRSPSLIFDIGFQLSFLATFGLIYLRPVFTLVPKIKNALEKTVVGEDLITTLTAQIITLPILLLNFGSYSLWSIPTNTLILWTVPILMIIGGFAAVVGILIEPLGRLILYLSIPFLLYFTKIVEFFSTFGGQIEIKSLPFIFICGYYLLIFSIILFIRNRK